MRSSSRTRSLALFAVAWPGLWLAHAGDAQAACSTDDPVPVPPPILELPADNIPADGVVLGRINCDGCTAADIQFETDAGPVAGAFEAVVGSSDARLFLWRPSAPLTPEEVLYAVLPERDDGRYAIHVAPEAGSPTVYPDLDVKRYPAGDEIGCVEYSSSAAAECPLLTYHTKTESRLTLFLPLGYTSQYLFEVTYSADGVDTVVSGLAADIVPHEFPGAPEEVCYSVTTVDPTDGATSILGSSCLVPALLKVGVLDEPFGDSITVLSSCVEPEPAVKDLWCDAFESALLTGDCAGKPEESCAAALEACEVPTAGSGGSASGGTGTGTDGGTGATSGGGTTSGGGGPGAETGGAPEATAAPGGCSVGQRSSRSMSLQALSLLAIVLLCARGRSRSRRHFGDV